MKRNLGVLCLRLDDGKVQPLAWTEGQLSKKRLRQVARHFRYDPDVVKPCVLHWTQLYRSRAEMMAELPKF